MNSILEIIELTERSRAASPGDLARLPNPISASCRELLAEARELGLTLDDVIDAVRYSATDSNNSN